MPSELDMSEAAGAVDDQAPPVAKTRIGGPEASGSSPQDDIAKRAKTDRAGTRIFFI
jgi:hypothetical protein